MQGIFYYRFKTSSQIFTIYRFCPQFIFQSSEARIYNIMSKKNLSKSINPLSVIAKSSKKGNKSALDDFIVESDDISIQPSSSEQPRRLKKLKKAGQREQEQKQKLIQEKIQKYEEDEQEEDMSQEEEKSEEIQYERFKKADDEDMAKMEQEKNKKKSKSRKKKGEQEIDKFVEKHPVQEKQKKTLDKPVAQTQLSLMSMFKSSSQPLKAQPSFSTRMQEEKPKGSSDSESEDSMQLLRKRHAMKNMSEQLNAGLSQQQALRQAMKESLKETKPIHKQPAHVPLQNYSYQVNKNKGVGSLNQLRKDLPKREEVMKKQPEKKKVQPKVEQKKQKPASKKQKSDHHQNNGPLSGFVIVTTGQFGDYSKNKMLELLEKLGADLPKGITKKTTHLFQGSHILNTFGRRTDQDVRTTSKSLQAAQKNIKIIPYDDLDNFFIEKTGKTVMDHMQKDRPQRPIISTLEKFVQIDNKDGKKTVPHEQIKQQNQTKTNKVGISVPWTQKYKPKSSQQIIGQISQIKNLKQWLDVWQDIHIRGNKRDVKPNFNAFLPSGTINSNAALLSGDAGLGKTTAARLIANQYGYSVVQYNASDARNKKSVEMISAGRNNMSFLADSKKDMQKTLIIMDEVDGMSSGDRGGITAIIDMIKKTKVPIICICNDRQATKIKSLAGHCYDIKFHKPDKRMIARRLQKIIEAEGGTSSIVALQTIVQLLQNDIRQILTYLEVMFKGGITNINADIVQRKCRNTKDNSLTINHFEAAKLLMSRTMFKDMTISQRVDLAYVDSDMVPLMIQENYLSACPKKKLNVRQFRKVVKATQGFVDADLLERKIMKTQSYCLMPNKIFLSCIYPSEMLCQNIGFPKFASWLGKFSTERKNKRLIKELKYELGCVSSVSFSSVKHHYVPMLLERIYQGMKASDPNVEDVVEFMIHYGVTPAILAEHLTCLQYGQRENLFKNIETSKKTKLTKAYNKICQTTKFKKQKAKVTVEHTKYDPVLGEMENEVDEEGEPEGEGGEESISDVVVAKKTDKSKPKKKK